LYLGLNRDELRVKIAFCPTIHSPACISVKNSIVPNITYLNFTVSECSISLFGFYVHVSFFKHGYWAGAVLPGMLALDYYHTK